MLVIPENKKDKCPKCNVNFNTLDIKYQITLFPEYILLIFDLHSYNKLFRKKKIY